MYKHANILCIVMIDIILIIKNPNTPLDDSTISQLSLHAYTLSEFFLTNSYVCLCIYTCVYIYTGILINVCKFEYTTRVRRSCILYYKKLDILWSLLVIDTDYFVYK